MFDFFITNRITSDPGVCPRAQNHRANLMNVIWLVAVLVLGLIVLAAITEIKGAPSSADIAAQCTPSRIVYTSYPSKRDRWIGLERSIREMEQVKRGIHHD